MKDRLGEEWYNPYSSLCMGCGEHIYYCTCKKELKKYKL